MIRVYPDFYEDFQCLAGSCPDTCCSNWQVVIDPETLAFYEAAEGPFGEKLRAAIRKENGEAFFCGEGDYCPLLTQDGLCSVQLRFGEEHLCKTCRVHPRFIEQYGMTEECFLSLSCPESANLLLRKKEPLTFLEKQDDRPLSEYNTLDPALYLALHQARGYAVRLVQDHSLSLSERIFFLLLFAKALQKTLRAPSCDKVGALEKKFSDARFRARQRVRFARMQKKQRSFLPVRLLLERMEHLTAQFPALLESRKNTSIERGFPENLQLAYENLLVYDLFRYFKKAVNDRDVYSRVCMCVFHLCALRLLQTSDEPDDFCRLCSLYAKEIEHSEENTARLLRTFRRRRLPLAELLQIL